MFSKKLKLGFLLVAALTPLRVAYAKSLTCSAAQQTAASDRPDYFLKLSIDEAALNASAAIYSFKAVESTIHAENLNKRYSKTFALEEVDPFLSGGAPGETTYELYETSEPNNLSWSIIGTVTLNNVKTKAVLKSSVELSRWSNIDLTCK